MQGTRYQEVAMALEIAEGTVTGLYVAGKDQTSVNVKIPTAPGESEWNARTFNLTLPASVAATLKLGDTLRLTVERVRRTFPCPDCGADDVSVPHEPCQTLNPA